MLKLTQFNYDVEATSLVNNHTKQEEELDPISMLNHTNYNSPNVRMILQCIKEGKKRNYQVD